MVKRISKIYQNLKCMPPLASTRFYISICVLFWGPESTGYAFLGYQKTKGFATVGLRPSRGTRQGGEERVKEMNGIGTEWHASLITFISRLSEPKASGRRWWVRDACRSLPVPFPRRLVVSHYVHHSHPPSDGTEWTERTEWQERGGWDTRRVERQDTTREPGEPMPTEYRTFRGSSCSPSLHSVLRPEGPFLGPGVQWICFFGGRSSMDMLFWGPESNGYAFLGYQKTKGFATGYAFLGPGVQWICFFGIPENQGICHKHIRPAHGYLWLAKI